MVNLKKNEQVITPKINSQENKTTMRWNHEKKKDSKHFFCLKAKNENISKKLNHTQNLVSNYCKSFFSDGQVIFFKNSQTW